MKRFASIALFCLLISITACATAELPAEEEPAPPIAVDSPVLEFTPTRIPNTPIPPNPTVTLRPFTSTPLPPEASATPEPAPTFTPEPPVATSPPTSYPVPVETPAEEPTPFEMPTEEPTPTGAPPVQPVTFETLPQLASDLLFLDGGRLMHWAHERNQLEVAVGPEELAQAVAERTSTHAGAGVPPGSVLGVEVSADSKRVAVIRRWHESHYEIARFEPATGLVESLVQLDRQIFTFALSPNGEWVAYMVREDSDHGQPEGPIYAFPWNNPAAQVEIGRCAAQITVHTTWGCGELKWSPDSRQLAWSDGVGVWLKGLQQGEARQLFVQSQADPSQEEGGGLARLQAWSPTGRYILTRVGYWEGSDKQVLDTETAQMVIIPDSSEYPMPNALSTWLADGRLFVIYPLYTGENKQEHMVRLWRIDPANPELLVLDGEFSLATAGFLGLPTQRTDGYVSVASERGIGQEAASGNLVLINPTTYEIIPISPLPNQEGSELEALWAPDNSGAIVSARWGKRMPLYIPADGQVIYDLTPIVSTREPCCFQWLPN